jgi:hypothetical protein
VQYEFRLPKTLFSSDYAAGIELFAIQSSTLQDGRDDLSLERDRRSEPGCNPTLTPTLTLTPTETSTRRDVDAHRDQHAHGDGYRDADAHAD